MAPHLRIAKTAVPHRSIGDRADTETSADILRTRELMQSLDDPVLTMIAGRPGIGKTLAVKNFCRGVGYGVFHMQAACGEGTAWNLAKCLGRQLPRETVDGLQCPKPLAAEAAMISERVWTFLARFDGLELTEGKGGKQ